ncbi:MAG: LPS export ABC transporter periplasmic protein LptC [Candidatus Omnitrophota bacterium]
MESKGLKRLKLKTGIVIFLTAYFSSACLALTDSKAGQSLDGFSLVQYEDNVKRKWQLEGKEANIEEELARIDEVSAIVFGKKAAFKLKAKKGYFDLKEQKGTLQEDVVIKSTDGTRVRADYLDWYGKTDIISSDGLVSIHRRDFDIIGKGVFYDLNQKIARFKEDVAVNSIMPDVDVVVTCDGPFEIDYDKGWATFYNNVAIKDKRGNVFSNRVDLYLGEDKKELEKIVARENVEISDRDNIITTDEAIYIVKEEKLILPNKPRLVMKNE